MNAETILSQWRSGSLIGFWALMMKALEAADDQTRFRLRIAFPDLVRRFDNTRAMGATLMPEPIPRVLPPSMNGEVAQAYFGASALTPLTPLEQFALAGFLMEDIAEALGCEPDNEVILETIEQWKTSLENFRDLAAERHFYDQP